MHPGLWFVVRRSLCTGPSILQRRQRHRCQTHTSDSTGHATMFATQKRIRTCKSNEQDPHTLRGHQAVHCHMQGQSKTCTHANAVYPCKHMQTHACSAMVFSYTAGPEAKDKRELSSRNKKPCWKNKHYKQEKGCSSTRRLQCENTATHAQGC